MLQHIAHECEAIRKAFNGLKYARGEPFKEVRSARLYVWQCTSMLWRERCGHRSLRTVLLLQEHWSSVFKKLSMAKGLALDSVNVGHFLEAQVLEAVAMHTTWLKDLHSRCVRTDAWRFTRWRAASCLHSFDLPC